MEKNPENIQQVYKTITGNELDATRFNTIQETQNVVSNLNKETKEAIIEELENQCNDIEESLETAKNSNGWLSGIWDGFKNWTGIGASSDKADKQLANMKKELAELKKNPDKLSEAYKNITGKDLTSEELNKFAAGETSLVADSKAGNSVNSYSEGQKMGTDVVADIVSGIVSVGAVAIGSAIGICAAPFTAGASLGMIAAGVGIGAAAGAAVKVAIKGTDCIGNEKEYGLKDIGYDVITGGINGAMGPVSNAMGGAAGTGIMKAAGMEALETTVKGAATAAGKEIVEEAAEQAIKQTAKQTVKQIAIKGLATTTDMVIDGAISGATDGFSRALGEGRIEDIPQDMLTGAAGGAIASPIIGGGMKLVGKAGSAAGNAIKNAVGKEAAENAGDIVSREISENISAEITEQAGKESAETIAGEVSEHISKETSENLSEGISEVFVENIDDTVDLDNFSKNQIGLEDLSSDPINIDNIGEQKIIVKESIVDNNGVRKRIKHEVNLSDWFNKYGVNISDVKPDALDFFNKLDPDVVTYLSSFELTNKQSYLQAILTKSTMFKNVDFSSLNKNADFLNFLNSVPLNCNNRNTLLEGIKNFNFIFNPNFDAAGMRKLLKQMGNIYNNRKSLLDNYSNAELQKILDAKHIDTTKACEFIHNRGVIIHSADGTKKVRILNILGHSNLLDILQNESTDYNKINNLIDYIQRENVFPDLTNKDMSTIAYMINHVSNSNGNISMENYVDLYKYFSDLTDKNGNRIFQDKLGSASSLNYIINNLDPSSVEASNIEMLIHLVQDGVVDKKVLSYMPQEGRINNTVVNDIEKLYDSYVMGIDAKEMFIPSFRNLEEAINGGNNSVLFKDTYKELNIGDVFQVDGEDRIRIKISDTDSQLLNISKDSYYELFPPVTRYATVQNDIGNCWEITGINSLLSDSKSRVRVLSCFGEELNENGEKVITVTFPNSTTPSVKLVDGQIPQDLEKYYSVGSKGVQILEYADGVEINKEKVNSFLQSLNTKIVNASTDEEREKLTQILVDLTEYIEKEGTDNINILYKNQNIAIGYTKYADCNKAFKYKSYTGKYGTAATESRIFGTSSNLYKRLGYSNAKRYNFADYNKSDMLKLLSAPETYENNVISWSSAGDGMELSINDKLGIVSRHAYRLEPRVFSSSGNVEKFALINPWGIEETILTLDEVYKYGNAINVTN